jgi:hypothetical protein
LGFWGKVKFKEIGIVSKYHMGMLLVIEYVLAFSKIEQTVREFM